MCKTKYKDTIASERSLRVEKISTKNVEHKDYPARKDTDIKFQGYEFKIENNCFVKSAQEEKNKEQENKYTEKSKRRDAKQHNSDQTKRMKIKFRSLRKHQDDRLNGMSNMMHGFLYEIVDNRK